MPADTSLGDAMSGLGQSLAQALNPLNAIRAQDMLAQMRQRQWEIQQKQALDAANANAAAVYRNANPNHLSPADLEVAVAQIRNGQFNASQTIEALKTAGGYQAAQAAAGLVDAQHPEWSPAQRSSAKQQILQGKSLSEVEQSFANDVKDTNAATQTVAATNAATTPASKEAAAIGQPETSVKLDTQGRLLTAPPIDGPLSDPNVRQQIDTRTVERAIAGAPVSAEAPVSAGVAEELARSRARGGETGKSDVTGVDPTKPIIANPLTTAPAGAPPTAPVQAAPPKGATPDPTHPGWYWQGGQLHAGVTTGGPAGTVFGTQPGDLDAAKGASEEAAKTLTGAYGAGEAATKLKTITNQIRGLSQIANTAGFWGQSQAGINNVLQEYNLAGITNAQQAQQAMANLLKNELPGVVKEAGMIRVAQPEIKAVGTMTGTADLPPAVLANILANVDAGADYIIKRKALAAQTLGFDPSKPTNYPEFQQGDQALLGDYNNQVDARRKSYGGIGGNQPPPQGPPVVTTTGGAPPTPSPFSWLGSLFNNLGAPPNNPSNTAPPPPDQSGNAPPASRELQYDQSTNTWR